MTTEKARQEVMARARTLDGLRDQAAGKEHELANRRAEVGNALSGQRALLGNVKGEIAKLLEEERKQALAEAQQQQQQAADDDPADGGSDGGSGGGRIVPELGGRDEQAPEEPVGPPPPVKGGAGQAVSTAAAQIGKPYEWAAAGPDSFDCSGLTMYAWSSAGVSLPHSSGAQFSSLPHVARGQLQAGDLVFFGSPIHHVGIYEGGGVMINAPETGENVRRDSIARADYVGAARP
jgi:cell wall-associated NlpC family hydrolase